LVEEAIVCLSCLVGAREPGRRRRQAASHEPALHHAFLADPIDDVGYFVDHRKKILKGVTYMYKTVCLLVTCVGNADTRAPAGTSNMDVVLLRREAAPLVTVRARCR
jgi:hypothetical protein